MTEDDGDPWANIKPENFQVAKNYIEAKAN